MVGAFIAPVRYSTSSSVSDCRIALVGVNPSSLLRMGSSFRRKMDGLSGIPFTSPETSPYSSRMPELFLLNRLRTSVNCPATTSLLNPAMGIWFMPMLKPDRSRSLREIKSFQARSWQKSVILAIRPLPTYTSNSWTIMTQGKLKVYFAAFAITKYFGKVPGVWSRMASPNPQTGFVNSDIFDTPFTIV
jgi:hypothetical protein